MLILFRISAFQSQVRVVLTRNIQSALRSMRYGLKPLGMSSAGFSRLTSSRIYVTFIRSKLEYGLGVSLFLKKDLKSLEKAQDQRLRMLFGGHRTSSTSVFKHMTSRVHKLVFMMIQRVKMLPDDTLLATIIRECTDRSFHWNKLVKSSVL